MKHQKMFKVFALFVCFHFCASQTLYFNRVKIASPSGPTKMDLSTSVKQGDNKLELQPPMKINSECKTMYLTRNNLTTKFFEGNFGQKCIFPFVMNGEVYNGCISINVTGSVLVINFQKNPVLIVTQFDLSKLNIGEIQYVKIQHQLQLNSSDRTITSICQP